MIFYGPDNWGSLPRSLGTSKIYTKGCSFGWRSLALEDALFRATDHGAIFSCMEVTP